MILFIRTVGHNIKPGTLEFGTPTEQQNNSETTEQR